MDKVKDGDADLDTHDSKTRTPAYANFDVNTDKLLHILEFVRRGTEHFVDELKHSIVPEVDKVLAELPGRNAVSHAEQETSATRRRPDIRERIQSVFLAPTHQFTEGLLAINQWLPVILVTTVEAYLQDVRIFEAKINPAVMESSEQSVTYADVVRAQSIGDLTEEMQSKWARNFVDDGGPARWIEKLTRMGARGYDPQTAAKMETLWGVRHVMVHSAGVATRDFVRRHPKCGVQVGSDIRISFNQVFEWIRLVYDFVEVTDSYFAQRYESALRSSESES